MGTSRWREMKDRQKNRYELCPIGSKKKNGGLKLTGWNYFYKARHGTCIRGSERKRMREREREIRTENN